MRENGALLDSEQHRSHDHDVQAKKQSQQIGPFNAVHQQSQLALFVLFGEDISGQGA